MRVEPENDFYARDTRLVAQEMLGMLLAFRSPEGWVVGRIVETEAYLGAHDPACHAARGCTPANRWLFGPAGRNYLFRSYGLHLCYNITTDSPETAAAVLIRALQIEEGLAAAYAHRPGVRDARQLANGPGKLSQALGLTMDLNGLAVRGGNPCLYDEGWHPRVVTTTRIGISAAADLPLRYYIADNRYISKK